MIANETPEERELRELKEKEWLEEAKAETERQRKFQLDKLRLESSVPRRWEGISQIFKCIFVLPIWCICITMLLLNDKKIPEFFVLTQGKNKS